ncbi:MAG: hypothetical protein M3O50_15975 [Myxococcota bacterium]|nr:hypothetical protein [Myxococcota bacterium]
MRVAFFGLPLAGWLLARDGHQIVWAGTCRRGAPGMRRLVRLAAAACAVPDTASDRVHEELRRARPDLIVSWFWTKRLPRRILDIAPAIGVHPSLLPRHRGADPYFWAIDAGDAVTGVTAHVLEDEYDAGDILAQRVLPIEPPWNAWQLARALDRPSLALLRDTVAAFAQRRPPPRTAQEPALVTLAPEPTDEQLALAWSWTAERIARRVRAAAPWPGAWTEIGERLVTLVRVRPTSEFPRTLQPGEGAVRADGTAVIRASDDALELLDGRSEDDEPLGARGLADMVDHARRVYRER